MDSAVIYESVLSNVQADLLKYGYARSGKSALFYRYSADKKVGCCIEMQKSMFNFPDNYSFSGFSNSDVLGSAKGWAGAFLYNPKAKEALDKFYAREDTLSLGICNGCQLMVELNLINPEHKHRSHLCHNTSKKFESTFLGLTIPQNDSVMFGSLSGDKLGIWVAHGEGRFYLPEPEDHYNIIAKYNYAEYPGNPNGSDYNVAGICSADGRHLAMMPHLERAIFPWQNAWYPADRRNDEVTPWIEAFVNARQWIEERALKK